MQKSSSKFSISFRSPALIGLLVFCLALVSGCETGKPIINPTSTLLSLQTETPAPKTTSTQTASPAPTATQLPTPTATMLPYIVPDWFETAVIYEIFVRSFADSNADGIGDLNGITQKLDYIQSLHVNTIWLMPIYPSPSVHGYDIIDHFAVNPEYGTMQDFQNLVEELHARDMRIILDFVPSHLAFDNPLFQDAYRNPEAEISDWFVFTNKNNTAYAGFADLDSMPRFNHYNPEVVQYLTDAALFWLDLDGDGDYTDGIDGFRVDNVTYPPQEFFIEWRKQIKAVNSDAILLGEAWVHNYRDLSIFFEHQFDALFDFPFYEILQGSQNSNNDGILAGKSMPILIKSLFGDQEKYIPEEGYLVRFLNNHDTNRIASELELLPGREKLAATILATIPGPVMMYYGEEIGMLGEKGGWPHWDNFRREPMDWYTSELGPDHAEWFMDEERWNQPDDDISVEEQEAAGNSILNYYRTVFEFRMQYTAFQTGEIEFQSATVSAVGPFSYTVSDAENTFLVILNFSTEAQTIAYSESPLGVAEWVDILSGDAFVVVEGDPQLSFNLEAGQSIILQAVMP